MKYSENQKTEWRDYVSRCGSQTMAAKHFGVPQQVIQKETTGALAEYKAKRDKQIIQMRIDNKSMNEIAESLNIQASLVFSICKKYELGGKRSTRKPDYTNMKHLPLEEDKARQRVNALPGFEYVGGYTGNDGVVRVRCMKCDHEWTQNYQRIRKGHGITCPACKERERIAKEELQRLEHEAAAIEKIMLSYRERIAEAKKKAESETKEIHCCPICGKPTIRRCCSDGCQRTYQNRTKEQNRRAKISNALIDSNITLPELYRRDGGVCHICGGMCDWTDCTETQDGIFIAGNNYPSIDHLIPLARNGKHSWDNVRLAHRLCNSLKGAEL